MIIAQYAIEEANAGLLGVLFPRWRVVRHPYPAFVADPEVIVFGERVPEYYEEKRVIQITRSSRDRLDSKEGLIAFLKASGHRISEDHQKAMMQMDDEEFWKFGKLAAFLGHLPKNNFEKSASLFELFNRMFESFDEAFKAFRKYGGSHKVAFSALLTMMQKTQMTDSPGLSAGYKKVLLKNKPYFSFYKVKVLEYVETRMGEMDFLAFLADLAGAKRSGA